MEPYRRMYFKKQIMKDIYAQKENNIEKENTAPMTDSDNIFVTVLGSSSYHEQNKRILDTSIGHQNENYENNIIKSEMQINDDQEFVKNAYCTTYHENIIQINIEPMEDNEGSPWTEKINTEIDHTQRDTVEQPKEIVTSTESIPIATVMLGKEQFEENKNNTHTYTDQETCNQEDYANSELHPTFTEIIADKEMNIMRKSLEEDDNVVEIDIGHITDKDVDFTEKKKVRSQAKKSYIDFLSDEEDFVWESSSWDGTGDSSASESDKPEPRKKKNKLEEEKVGDAGLKRKKINKRKAAKEARQKGKELVKKDGSIVSSRSMKPNPCIGKSCGHNCQDVTEEKRRRIFEYFWNQDSQRKKDWLVSMTMRNEIKRKRSDSNLRENTYYYHINDGEGRRKICKKFLMATLDVTNRYIQYNLDNSTFGLSKLEARGKTVPKNKTSDSVKESAVNFIKSLPALPSHYCRKDTTRLYLPTEFKSIKNLYRIYKEALVNKGINVVGEQIFRDIFNKEFNIGFHVPKKDKCVKCLRFEGGDVNENPDIMTHLKEKEASKKRLNFHRELSKKNQSMLCTSFDLQKVLNTPHGHSMLLFYSRKYTVYNLCFYESVTRKGYCYTWGETEGKRGGNEIATILQKYIADVDARGSITTLILYSDSCPGQNKNKIVLSAIHNALLQTRNLETIQFNYLLPGHTEMTVDSIHATIDNSIKNNIIWAPSQWTTVFQLARKVPEPYIVENLIHKDFKNFEEFSEKYFKGNLTGKISKVRIATFKKSTPNIMTVKYSMIEEAEEDKIGIIARPKALHQKYKTPLPLTTAKYTDLKKLCDTGVIPRIFHSEYSSFNHRTGNDFLIDSDLEDEIENVPV